MGTLNKINFLISQPVGTLKNRLKEMDSSFERPKHMFKLMNKTKMQFTLKTFAHQVVRD